MLLAATLAWASAASADSLTFRSPSQLQFVKRGDQVPVKVGGAPRRARLRLWRDGVRVPVRRPLRVATAGLHPGRHQIHVEAIRGDRVLASAGRTIVVGVRRPGVLTRVPAASARRAFAQDAFGRRIQAGLSTARPVGVRVSGRPVRVRFWLNGRRVADRYEFSHRALHAVLLGADDGLRFGRNRLRVMAHREDGGYEVMRRRIRVRRTAALPGAGGDRHVRPRGAVRLDASDSRPARRGVGLSYRWRVVRKPAGTHPRLVRPRSVRPTFRPRRPGVYRLAVRVRERRRGAHAAVAPASEDVVTVTSAPDVAAAGMPLSLDIQDGSGKITFGASTVGCDSGSFCVVKLDQATLASQGQKTVSDSSTSATQARQAATGDAAAIKQYLANVSDGTQPAADVITLQIAPQLGWSAVWVGTRRALANTAHPAQAQASWINGSIRYVTLQRDIGGGDSFYPANEAPHPRYTVRSTEYLPFYTRTETGPSLTNTMSVAGGDYTASLPAGATGGFALLLFDNQLDPVAGYPKAFATTTGDKVADAAALSALGSALGAAKAADQTILLQSIGAPHWQTYADRSDNRQAWDQFAIDRINPLGGDDDIFDALPSTADARGGSYALVASPRNVSQPQAGNGEASLSANTGGSLAGVLTRAANGDLAPAVTDTGGPEPAGAAAGRFDLNGLAFGPGAAWPAWTKAEQAAAADLAKAAQVPEAQHCPAAPDPIRAIYCADNPGVLAAVKDRVHDADPDPNGAYTTDEFKSVQSQYKTEIDDVGIVRGWVAKFQTLFTTTGLTSLSAANDIKGEIVNGIPVSSGGPTVGGVLNTFAALTALVAPEAEIEIGELKTDVSALASNAMWTGSALAVGSGGDGDPIFNDITSTADGATGALVADLIHSQDYFKRLGDLLVSDPVKLTAAARNIGGPWAFDETQLELQNAITAGVRQWLWGQILSSVYRVYYAPTSYSTNPRCVKNYPSDNWSGNLHPFVSAPAYTWNTHEPRAGLYTWFGRKDTGPYATRISPPDLTNLFTRPDLEDKTSRKAGAVREWFAHRWFEYQALPPDKTPNGCGAQNLAPPR